MDDHVYTVHVKCCRPVTLPDKKGVRICADCGCEVKEEETKVVLHSEVAPPRSKE